METSRGSLENVHIEGTDETSVWADSGDIILESGREIDAGVDVEAYVRACSLPVVGGADIDTAILAFLQKSSGVSIRKDGTKT